MSSSGLSVGIVGLPNVGKSTLFNALLAKQVALAANYPFATIEPNIGVVPVPDERLTRLAEITKEENKMLNLPPIKSATVEFVDIAGIVKGASEGAGLGNKFLAHIREVKIIAHVVRVFEDSNVVKEGAVDPKSDYEMVRTELGLADLEAKGERLTEKPEIIVLNVSENSLKDSSKIIQEYSGHLGVSSEKIVVICAKIESELAELGEEDSINYLKELEVDSSGLEKLIQKSYEKLGLISFLTAGVKEVRAWTVKNGSNAVEAAGEIHTDFMKKFIKAEVVRYGDFVSFGGWKGSRAAGKARLEGKEYVMRDADVVEFKIGR